MCNVGGSRAMMVVCGVMCFADAVSAQSIGFSTVWLTNGAAPGLASGVKQLAFERPPVINSSGVVAFEGSLSGTGITGTNDRAMFVGLPGGLAPSLRAGSLVPGGTAGAFVSSPLYTVNLADSGEIAVAERLVNSAGTTNLGTALEAGVPGATSLLLQIGTGTVSNVIKIYAPLMGASGQVGYLTDVQTNGTQRALWTGSATQAPTRVISQGDAAPGFAPGATVTSIASSPTMSDKGSVAFVAGIRVTASNTPTAILAGPAGGLQRVATSGDAVPGLAGSTLRDLTASPAQNRAGDLAFPASYMQGSNAYMGVFASSVTQPTSLRSVYLGNQALPGTPAGTTTSNVFDVSIGSTGSVAFMAQLNIGGAVNTSNNLGIWISRGSTVTTIARTGQSAPGIPGSFLAGIGNVNGAESQLNALDQLAFVASTNGGSAALYAWDPTVGLILVARTGALFTISPGVTRSISSISFQGAQKNPYGTESILPGGTGGTASGLNDAGQLVFGLGFADGTYGVFETVVPAPSGAAALSLLAVVGRRRRRG